MRITEIEIKNFKAFYGTYRINLHKAGKNLLIYGENGSGKSSLYFALKLFLESGDNPSHRFENDQNRFITDAAGHIKLGFRANRWSKQETYEWSENVRETEDELIIEASKAKGFLDYKSLLETHYIHRASDTVNVFNLLVETLLANTVNTEGQSLAADWARIQLPFPRRNAINKIADLEELIENFNNELANRLAELQPKVSEILGKFEHNVAINFDFPRVKYNRETKKLDNQQILLTVDLFNTNIPEHHLFLNEARLSAIAIAIYLSSILV